MLAYSRTLDIYSQIRSAAKHQGKGGESRDNALEVLPEEGVLKWVILEGDLPCLLSRHSALPARFLLLAGHLIVQDHQCQARACPSLFLHPSQETFVIRRNGGGFINLS